MPEGDNVHRAARRLHGALAGQRLQRTDFRVSALANADLAGQTVLEVRARGKYLLFRTSAGWTVITHFMMDGEWGLFRPQERWRGGPAYEIRVVLETEGWVAVGYRLPVVELVRSTEEERIVGHLGPDVLAAGWDAAEAVRRLRAEPGVPVGEALLDQRKVAGLGNVYRNELMFLRGLYPWQAIGEVRDVLGMLALARRLLQANVRHSRRTTTGSTRPGETSWVYDRAGLPCRRCGTAVRTSQEAGERRTWWCPHCQPGG